MVIAYQNKKLNIISTGPYHDPWQSVYPDNALHISNYYIIIRWRIIELSRFGMDKKYIIKQKLDIEACIMVSQFSILIMT